MNNNQTLYMVVDTNSYVSAAISPNGTVARALDLARREGVVFLQSPETAGELLDVLQRPKIQKLIGGQGKAFAEAIIGESKLIAAPQNSFASKDPKDNKFLDVAIAGRADYLMSGDKGDVMDLKKVPGVAINTQIVSASGFIAQRGAAQALQTRRAELGLAEGDLLKPPALASIGLPLSQVYPASYHSMTRGRDEMGERSEISRIAVERTGFDYGDARNDMRYISARNRRGFGPNAHMLMLADGTVQGPEAGGVDFGRNPQIAAGKNGGTLGVMYVGAGAMNKAQQQSFAQIQQNLQQQRQAEGLTGPIEVIAGSTRTAQLLNLPTPRGPLVAPNTAPYVPAIRSNFKASVG